VASRGSEKDYASIAQKRMHRPADLNRRLNLLVYSRNKKGKTNFGVSAGIGKTLVIDPERGTDPMKKANPHVWPVDAWADMDEVYNFARYVNECPFKGCEYGEKHPFEWIHVDGLTKMANYALKYVMKLAEERSMTRIPGMVQLKDYGKAGELMKDMLTNFHNLDQGAIFTAQERQVEAQDSEEDDDIEGEPSMYVPDLPKGARGSANAIVDVIGRLYVVRVDKGDKVVSERRLWIGESVKYDTGYRSDFGPLPDMIRNPTIPKLVSLINTGNTGAKKKTAKKTALKLGRS
jgi:hypothetical protein